VDIIKVVKVALIKEGITKIGELQTIMEDISVKTRFNKPKTS